MGTDAANDCPYCGHSLGVTTASGRATQPAPNVAPAPTLVAILSDFQFRKLWPQPRRARRHFPQRQQCEQQRQRLPWR